MVNMFYREGGILLDLKVFYIFPIENGLKSYVQVNGEYLLFTFETGNNVVDFKTHSDGELSEKILSDSNLRQEFLNRFMMFLNRNKEDIQVGVYLDNDKTSYDKIFRLLEMQKDDEGRVTASFFISDKLYKVQRLRILRKGSTLYFDESNCLLEHWAEQCFCNKIKEKHDIQDFEPCLVLFEHLTTILDWLLIEYKKQYPMKNETKIIQFPAHLKKDAR